MIRHYPILAGGALLALLSGIGCSDDGGTGAIKTTAQPAGLERLNHIVVIYLENHSFDNLYGEFPGAQGLASDSGTFTQVDASNKPFEHLPQPMDTSQSPPVPDTRFPGDLPNAPFAIEDYVKDDQKIPDLVHRYYQERAQINDGAMNKFALVSDAKGLAMGHYHTMNLPLPKLARDYVVCDQFYHSAFGGSFLNHIWLVAAASPVFPDAPAAMVAQIDASGNVVQDGAVSPEGFVINTAFSTNTPHPSTVSKDRLVPNQTMPTIGDRLDEAKLDWAWYSGGWDDAVAGNPDPSFQFHHQPFVYFDSYKDGSPAKAKHLKDEKEFMKAAKAGQLPSVAFVKPLGINNEHPGYADVLAGDQHVVDLINAVKSGPNWKDTAIIITYDEHGGFWDHVPPPTVDRWGPGLRVPTIVVSPFAKKAHVDHSKYETVSILATIEHRFALEPLGARDGQAADLASAFDFESK